MRKDKRANIDNLPSIEEILKDALTVEEANRLLARDRTDYDRDPAFVSGYLKMVFVNDVCGVMHNRHMSKKALAETLGKSRQYVGRILNETANFTIETMAEIACALGMGLSIQLHALDEYVKIVPTPSARARTSNGKKKARRPALSLVASKQKRRAVVRPAVRANTLAKTRAAGQAAGRRA